MTWHNYDDANHIYENEDAVAVLDGREILGEGVGFAVCPDQADSYAGGWAYIRDELLPKLAGEGYMVDAALVSASLTDGAQS